MALPIWLLRGRPNASVNPITIGTRVAARAITEGMKNVNANAVRMMPNMIAWVLAPTSLRIR